MCPIILRNVSRIGKRPPLPITVEPNVLRGIPSGIGFMPVPDDPKAVANDLKAVAGYISCVYNRLHAGSSG